MPLYDDIYKIVRQIPKGKVATYGQIAKVVGGCSARMIGYAMSALKDGRYPDVPWQRVINAKGQISMHGIGSAVQRILLEEEGIKFNEQNRIDFDVCGWNRQS